jgi:hypothetical protein
MVQHIKPRKGYTDSQIISTPPMGRISLKGHSVRL